MKKKYWFAAKRYGWGWTPSTWQGWLILAVAVLLMLLFMTIPNLLARVVWVTVVAIALIWVCYLKGEKPGWRWG